MNKDSSLPADNAQNDDRHHATDAEAIAQLRNLLLNCDSTQPSENSEDEAIAQLRDLLQPEEAAPEEEKQALSELRQLILNNEQNPASDAPAPTDSTQKPDSLPPNTSDESATEVALAELRNLLFNTEKTQLGKLQQRLDDPKVYAEDLSRVLPEAIILLSLQRHERLTNALLPTIEEALQISVKKDVNIIANAIFPVMGPAIRKSIQLAISTLVQSLNQTLEHSLSLQSFKWRLEAKQTGKSFAEVVLLRTLLYRVEQVFLIHKTTGLVLQHIVAESVAAQDADLVSAMLRAIQDFVQDSFNVPHGDALQTLSFGELTIWIEEGNEAILAGVIRGNAPTDLRLNFQDAIAKIHSDFRTQLAEFQGDNQPFEPTIDYLQECLQSQYAIKKEKSSLLLPIIFGSILLILGIWGFIAWREKQRWATFIDKLNEQPGMVVTDFEKRSGKYQLIGMRDPLATDPNIILQAEKLNPKAVVSHWEPYLSFEPSLIEARANQLLQPPKTVNLQVDKNAILSAKGSANRQWIVNTQRVAKTIPGVTQYNDEDLIQIDFEQLQLSKAKIENQIIKFDEGDTQIASNQEQIIHTLVREINKLYDAAPLHNKNVNIQVIGHTNNSGSEKENLLLSQTRAYAVLDILKSQGLNNLEIAAIGVGAKQPLPTTDDREREEINRSVTFKVFLTDSINQKTDR
ncbi:OmpA family protein [Aliterella atlantica]|uniref:OmpA family protein n=1 Tax=Aliterella atlantica TaxID=1827278 RepID=UPI0005D410C1|nr:OmpA family protein [Aliterella atlantica]